MVDQILNGPNLHDGPMPLKKAWGFFYTPKNTMHYKNGREAKQGDKVVSLTYGRAGVLHSLNAGSTTCNARLAPTSDNDLYVTLSECLHLDDVAAAFAIPDMTKVGVPEPQPPCDNAHVADGCHKFSEPSK